MFPGDEPVKKMKVWFHENKSGVVLMTENWRTWFLNDYRWVLKFAESAAVSLL